ncbi:ABC transporter permease [Phreatobacter cathodiphilus]|uniref:ABC transporter permease n=1 Tax=Phreatobacter cathodiphilus TaxID=1868589 RepID=A0A2S0NFI3_9HYPH|nr:ABC transporter permease [Phreatobacter cathodiphilus]AVO46944.1 ABC transporter permease [Phreatobacter cathodiphilus]
MGMTEAILLTIITAATPLLIAALGELVVERSGVLNLGVEGMMIVGAATGFAAAVLTGSTLVGVLAGIAAGMILAAIFAALALGLAANQVATGLALTILGIGLSGLIGRDFVGARRDPLAKIAVPWLSDLPMVGKVLFAQDPIVYASALLAVGVWWFLWKTRAGLVLRAVGESHGAAHALGYPVLRIRLLAVLFGGGCAGLAGAYLSLAYTPFWSPGMTAGRGWIALAIVVFAGWLPLRAVIGAYLFGGVTVLQLHAQARGWGIPSQAMSALPYLATIAVLVVIALRRQGEAQAPASLGTPFVPDR